MLPTSLHAGRDADMQTKSAYLVCLYKTVRIINNYDGFVIVIVQNIYLSRLLLESHEVQIGDVDHVRAAHHCQHPVLHLPRQSADIQ